MKTIAWLIGLARRRKLNKREEGAALLSILVMLSVIGATTADFAFSAKVDYAAAINARDELRAHYLSRSSINLGMLLLRVQQRMIDPMIKKLGFDIQIADYASFLMGAFNDKDGAAALGSLLGLDGAEIKGLGVDVGNFDLQMTSLDGRVNLNCLGGANPDAPAVKQTVATLAAMLLPQRYNRLFETADDDGQFNDRLSTLQAIVDWVDQDQQRFGTSNPEDYRYNQRVDKYETKNQYFDTIEELRLVQGIGDDFMAAFGEQFTVYGDCKVNLALAGLPTIQALIQQFADPNDPALQYRNLSLLARYVSLIGSMSGGFKTVDDFIKAVQDPVAQMQQATAVDSLLTNGEGEQPTALPVVSGIKLDAKIKDVVVASGPRRIWRIKGISTVGRVQRTITAIWDQQHISSQAGRFHMGNGGFLYWREQ